MSLAAQFGTAPLVLYHFGTFPTYFLLTNMVVVPGLSVLLLVSIVWWVLLLARVPWAVPLGALLQHVVTWLNEMLRGIGQWPGAVLHVEGYGLMSMLFSYLFILFAGLFAIKKWKRGALLALASLLGLLLTLLLKP
jgi:competence protein ComEC